MTKQKSNVRPYVQLAVLPESREKIKILAANLHIPTIRLIEKISNLPLETLQKLISK